jgi:2-polyprenyl-3-methyl-5-hydroxy-6-metoxy-1,4-benzoquinol methylase
MESAGPVEVEALKEFAKRVFGALQGAVTAGMIHLGDRLGLYRLLAEAPATSAELAARSGLDERWVREWLRQQAASQLVAFDAAERFSLTPEAVAVLADERHPAFGGGTFSQLPQMMAVLDRLPEAFRTGLGLPYDAFGPEGARGIERGFAPWYRTFLVPLAIPSLEGVKAKLEAGAKVADVGCGGGVALLELAKAFPKAELHGYDLSRHAIERAERNRAAARVDNVSFHDARGEALPNDARFDLVLTFDCLHDMTRPQEVAGAIRRAIRDDGTWLIADIKSKGSLAANVERNPMAALMYGMSVMSCMSSALSEPGGAGLGTLGFDEETARAMTRAAGFTRFRTLDFGHPINAFYEVRP